jgi:histidinol-phosphate aminotransferase
MVKKIEIEELVRENVRQLKPYSSARDEYVSDGSRMVFLDANESPYDNGVNRYPDPQQQNLKQVLAGQKGVEANRILLGNGSDENLDLLFRAFCEPHKDNILTLPPTYGMYGVLADINAVENRQIPLRPDFQPDVATILNMADGNSKILFLCSPNNPTANSLSGNLITQLLHGFPGLVVIDEAYIDFSGEESWLAKLEEWPNLVVTQTLSKAYGMAGIRLGICFASETIINTLNRIKPPYNINELTQKRALQGLGEPERIKAAVAEILEERQKLILLFRTVPWIEEIFPTDANFILARVDNAPERYRQLLERGIVVRNRSGLPLCENTLRITVGTPEENKFLINVIKAL